MSLEIFNLMKERYDITVPIRGRAVDTRPWGERRRDAELIVRMLRHPDGAYMYGAKLYDTVVFYVTPEGDLHFCTNDWNTKTTSEFLSKVMNDVASRFVSYRKYIGMCIRRFNRLWVALSGSNTWRAIPKHGDLVFTYNAETNSYSAPMTKIKKHVVNRKRIKAIRDKIKPFKDYYTAMLKLSDGFVSGKLAEGYAVSRESLNQGEWYFSGIRFEASDGRSGIFQPWSSRQIDAYPSMYELLCSGDEKVFQPLMYSLTLMAMGQVSSDQEPITCLEGKEVHSYSYRNISPKMIDDMVTHIIKKVVPEIVFDEVIEVVDAPARGVMDD